MITPSGISWFNLAFLEWEEEDTEKPPQYEKIRPKDFIDYEQIAIGLDSNTKFDDEHLPQELLDDWFDPINKDKLPTKLYFQTKKQYEIRANEAIQQPDTQNDFDDYWNEKMKRQKEGNNGSDC